MRINMKDLTVLIPIRVENLMRLENVLGVVNYLVTNFDLNIVVLEANKYDTGILRSVLPSKVNHIFMEDKDPIFYRTKYINKMACVVKTPFLAVWDADVVFPVAHVEQALDSLRSGVYDVAFPYSGTFLDTTELIREMYLKEKKLDILEGLRGMMKPIYGTNMKGGAFLANTEKYRAAGMENLAFYGWGPEDWERYERWKNLGYRIKIVDGVLFHLSHPRDMNGTHNNPEQKKLSFYEKDITCYSSADEIRRRMNLP